jgi:hypothetical protein
MRLDPKLRHDTDQLAPAPGTSPGVGLYGDIPGPIWIAFLSAWALVFGLFVLFFSTDGKATMMVLTASFFALMTLGLPAALGTVAAGETREWPRVIVTHSGPLPVWAAAAQILLIPVAAVIGLIGFISFGM